MILNSLALWLAERAAVLNRLDMIHLLESLGFWSIGSGYESMVYVKAGCAFVVKLTFDNEEMGESTVSYCGDRGYYLEGQFPERIEMIKNDEAFAETYIFPGWKDKSVENRYFLIIQEKCEVLEGSYWPCFGFLEKRVRKGWFKMVEKVSEKYGFRDIRGGNIGLVNGRLKIFDWQIDYHLDK